MSRPLAVWISLCALAQGCSSTPNRQECVGSDEAPLATVTVTVGAPRHVWNPLTGGVIWLSTRLAAKQHAAVLPEYPGDILLDLKENEQGFGYRFDKDYFEPSTEEHGWFGWDGTDGGQPTTIDDLFRIYERPNVKFILNLPIPKNNVAVPVGQGNGDGFLWQTPAFYAAQCQYLFGNAGAATEYQNLPTSLDFSNQAASFNWANLRARRGRVAPYAVQALILGEEPYYIEGWNQDGAGFGARAEQYRAAIRARGITIPYGVHVTQLPPTDTERPWFFPMLNALSAGDPPKFLDLYHYYSFSGSEDWERTFPISVQADGFQNWWVPKSTWKSDYTRYLWLIEDTRNALKMAGRNPDDYKLGFSEHGILISSRFMLNDMKGALSARPAPRPCIRSRSPKIRAHHSRCRRCRSRGSFSRCPAAARRATQGALARPSMRGPLQARVRAQVPAREVDSRFEPQCVSPLGR